MKKQTIAHYPSEQLQNPIEKFTERGKIDIPSIQIHDRSLSALDKRTALRG